jgi:hypothetical protein
MRLREGFLAWYECHQDKHLILSNPNGNSRPTHPTSSIYTMDEAPLSRGDFRKVHSALCSI